MRRLHAIALALALAPLSLSALGCGRTETYEGQGFTFEHPSDWEPVKGVEFPGAARGGPEGNNVVGLDVNNWASVTAYPKGNGVPVDDRNIKAYLPAARDFYTRLEKRAAGQLRLVQPPFLTQQSALPGVRVRIAFRNPRGVPVESEVTSLYRGPATYVINCQNEPARATEVAAGCAQLTETFEPTSEDEG